jgi:hypothetical protein
MTTDDRTLNLPAHGATEFRWKPHKSILIEVSKEPGGAPWLNLCGQGAATLEQVDGVIAALREARYTLTTLRNLHEEGLRGAIVVEKVWAAAEADFGDLPGADFGVSTLGDE